MKLRSHFLAALFLATMSDVCDSQTPDSEAPLAKKGNGVVTQGDFKARALRIPEESRFTVLRDRARMQGMLNSMLLTAQLVADAEAAGLAQDPEVQARMALAAQEELARAWLEEYVERAEPADYEAMAKEQYLLNQDQYQTKERVDVTHLLISTEERSDDEALALVESVTRQIGPAGENFDDLVLQYSEDSGLNANQGRYAAVERGQMVKPFEERAFSLEEGVISEPVKTRYGYHLIRLNGRVAPSTRPYSDVREQILLAVKKQHREDIKERYLRQLHSEPVTLEQDAVEQMIENIFGRDVMSKYQDDSGAR